MKKFFTSGKCPKCGKQLLTSDIEGYSFVCEKCDENFYTIEVKENMADLFEINIEMTTDMFTENLEKLRVVANKYNFDFLGHDDVCRLADFGWEKGFPNYEVLNSFVKDIENIIN